MIIRMMLAIILFPIAIISILVTVLLLAQLFAAVPQLPPPSCDDIPLSMECV